MIQQVYISSDIREREPGGSSFNSVQPYLSNLCINVIHVEWPIASVCVCLKGKPESQVKYPEPNSRSMTMTMGLHLCCGSLLYLYR